MCCKDGVVFGVEKLVLSKLYEHGANKRILHIDNHIGMVRFPLCIFLKGFGSTSNFLTIFF